jgi:hypothetical protein
VRRAWRYRGRAKIAAACQGFSQVLTGEHWCQPEIVRLEAAFISDDPGGKADLLHRAIELSREQGSNLWKLRSAIDLAELLRNQGQPDQARELLAPIHGWFSEGFDTPDMRRGSRVLETLG